MSTRKDTSTTPARAVFKETQWKMVLAAKNRADPNSEQALAMLCQEYQDPIYAFIRRKGNSRHDAQDLTQEFFYRFISKEYLQSVDPEKGRFRTFLLTALQRFLCNEWERSQAQKRGGGALMFTWDADAAEERYCQEPSHDLTPEKLFERQWANTLLKSTMEDLRSEYERSGNGRLFQVLEPFVGGKEDGRSYAEPAETLSLTEGNARQWAHRIRKRYGELLLERIRETVDSEEAVQDEMRGLYTAWSG